MFTKTNAILSTHCFYGNFRGGKCGYGMNCACPQAPFPAPSKPGLQLTLTMVALTIKVIAVVRLTAVNCKFTAKY